MASPQDNLANSMDMSPGQGCDHDEAIVADYDGPVDSAEFSDEDECPPQDVEDQALQSEDSSIRRRFSKRGPHDLPYASSTSRGTQKPKDSKDSKSQPSGQPITQKKVTQQPHTPNSGKYK